MSSDIELHISSLLSHIDDENSVLDHLTKIANHLISLLPNLAATPVTSFSNLPCSSSSSA